MFGRRWLVSALPNSPTLSNRSARRLVAPVSKGFSRELRRTANLPRKPLREVTVVLQFPRRKFLHLAAGAAALPVASRLAWSQAYPTRPVRFIVPLAPGGGLDFVARLTADYLSRSVGQQ